MRTPESMDERGIARRYVCLAIPYLPIERLRRAMRVRAGDPPAGETVARKSGRSSVDPNTPASAIRPNPLTRSGVDIRTERAVSAFPSPADTSDGAPPKDVVATIAGFDIPAKSNPLRRLDRHDAILGPARPGSSPAQPTSGGDDPAGNSASDAGAAEILVNEGHGGADPLTGPLALVAVIQQRQILTAVSPEARILGVRPGMTATEARAICPALALRPAEPEHDTAEWIRLAKTMYRWSPLCGWDTGLGAAEGRSVLDPFAAPVLWVDIAGTRLLHGREADVLRRIEAGLAKEGYTVFLALADTMAAARSAALVLADEQTVARALDGDPTPAEASQRLYRVPPGRTLEAVGNVTVAALKLDGPTLDAVTDLALDTVAALLRIDRPVLAARFGEHVPRVLDELIGRSPQPLVPQPTDNILRILTVLDGPTDRQDSLLFVLKRMAEELHDSLLRAAEGAREIELVLWRPTASVPPLRAEIRLSAPQRDAAVIFRMLRQQFDRMDLAQPIDEIELKVPRREPLATEAGTLYVSDREEAPRQALGSLLDHLREHLGHEAVRQWSLTPDHRPEGAATAGPAELDRLTRGARKGGPDRVRDVDRRAAKTAGPTPSPVPHPPRPTVLVEPPAEIHLRDLAGVLRFDFAGRIWTVRHRIGPERIDTHWWTADRVRRDYQLLQTNEGPFFWIFRDATDGATYLHGIHD